MPLVKTAPHQGLTYESYLTRVAYPDDAARVYSDDAGGFGVDPLAFSTAPDGTLKAELVYTDSQVEDIVRRACEKILQRERQRMLGRLEAMLRQANEKREAATDYTEEAYIFGGCAAGLQEAISELQATMEGKQYGKSEF
jgi:hypothetical protein